MVRVLTRNDGYSLVELLVTMALVGLIASSSLGIYQVAQQTYTRAVSLEDAQSASRAVLDRMASDFRFIGSFWTGASGAGSAITAATSGSITFYGDTDANTLDSDGNEDTLALDASSGSTVITVSRATGADGAAAFVPGAYVYLDSGAAREVRSITAVLGTAITLGTALAKTYPAGSLVRAVETVTYTFNPAPANTLTRSLNGGTAEVLAANVTGLTLTYFDGSSPPAVTTTLDAIRQIEVTLTVRGPDGSARRMTTRVKPPNLALT
ncbi:MAG: type II secretion system protein [Candidatus Rokubacteria bacterium]|nr:type II secretion system protein [Candidatus Rokubacteria bacterium]